MAVGRKDYKERKERKIEAYQDRAAKANAVSIQLSNRAREIGSVIPFGQPILVGHHSEKRHRALISKINAAAKKSIEASDKAAYYQGRAETAACNKSISIDDPEAISKYEKKLSKLELLQKHMKAANQYWRKNKTMKGCPGLSDEEAAQIDDKMKTAYSWVQKTGLFEDWKLANNNAEINRIKAKIAVLQKLDSLETETKFFHGGKLLFNTSNNRVQFFFDSIPSVEIRTLLKKSGFRWAPSEGAWQRQRNPYAINAATRLIEEIEILSA